jgi:hypothetical protein
MLVDLEHLIAVFILENPSLLSISYVLNFNGSDVTMECIINFVLRFYLMDLDIYFKTL